jgi:tetratricopeptide (TPR) repeat protein
MLPTNIGESGLVRTSRTKVVGLSEHRSRRRQRLLLARAMQSGDPVRAVLVEHLSELTALTGADRAAAVWIDEYAENRVHSHVALDLLSDRPRRSFPLEPLERAWEIGLPGVFEGTTDAFRRLGDGSHLFAVSLGSDGARAWFLVCDSVNPRARLSAAERERVLFLAGECAAALLHQDLDQSAAERTQSGGQGMPGFVGFQVLQDLDGDDRPDALAKVDQRFLLVRLVRSFMDDEPGPANGADWADRVARARSEISKKAADGGLPLEAFESLLDALATQRHSDVADRLIALGEQAEAEGHTHSALDMYRCAFDAAAAVAYPAAAVDAARFQGRVLRRSARWDEAIRAYGVGKDVAVAAELWEKAVQVSVGLASLRQENGNLPAARMGLEQALGLASRTDDRNAVANVHHGLLGLEHAAGNNEAALRHGWNAVANHTDSTQRLRCLAGLAGVLVDFGDFNAAEDAWSIVSRESSELYYRTYAHDALAYLAALRGDLGEFERQAALCDALGWDSGPRSAMAEILYYRGLSYRALGLRDAAERWLARAVRHAEEFNLNRTLFRAEEAIRTLAAERKEAELAAERNATPSAPTEIREGLREMRRALAGAAS